MIAMKSGNRSGDDEMEMGSAIRRVWAVVIATLTCPGPSKASVTPCLICWVCESKELVYLFSQLIGFERR